MLEALVDVLLGALKKGFDAHQDQKMPSQKSMPWILRVELPITVQEYGPIGATCDDLLVREGVSIAR
jgi:hypothetical protein